MDGGSTGREIVVCLLQRDLPLGCPEPRLLRIDLAQTDPHLSLAFVKYLSVDFLTQGQPGRPQDLFGERQAIVRSESRDHRRLPKMGKQLIRLRCGLHPANFLAQVRGIVRYGDLSASLTWSSHTENAAFDA